MKSIGKKIGAVILGLVILGGCSTPQEPAVGDVSQDKLETTQSINFSSVASTFERIGKDHFEHSEVQYSNADKEFTLYVSMDGIARSYISDTDAAVAEFEQIASESAVAYKESLATMLNTDEYFTFNFVILNDKNLDNALLYITDGQVVYSAR